MKNDKIKVLYVEDEPNIAELLRAGLSLFGMVVHPIYCSAEELLERTATPEFTAADIMFLDIRLPGLTGLELAKKLRALGDKRPIVIVSAYGRPDETTLNEIGATFQPKPFDFDKIVRIVQSLLKSR